MCVDQTELIEAELTKLGLSLEVYLKKDDFDAVSNRSGQSHWYCNIDRERPGHSYGYDVEYHQGSAYRATPHAMWQAQKSGRPVKRVHIPQHRVSYDQRLLLEKSKPITPKLIDVVHALVVDAGCVCNGESFDDFCDEFGYDNDSITHRKCYDACVETWQALIRMGLDLGQLQELYQDY